MIIRELKKEDIPAIEAIYDLYWTGGFRENLSRRLQGFLDRDPEIMAQGFRYFVAQDEGGVVGVAAFRKAPAHMRQYTETKNPAEFYILAVKDRRKGTGTKLREKRLEEAKRLGYTEIVFFSGETHKEHWPFHDNSGFKRVADAIAPDGEPGHIWRMEIK